MSSKRVQGGKADSEAASSTGEVHAPVPIEAPQEQDIAYLGPVTADDNFDQTPTMVYLGPSEKVRLGIGRPPTSVELWAICKHLMSEHKARKGGSRGTEGHKLHDKLHPSKLQPDRNLSHPNVRRSKRRVPHVSRRSPLGQSMAVLQRHGVQEAEILPGSSRSLPGEASSVQEGHPQ